MKDEIKEKEFYSKEFNFSYSSLNKLIFSPSLFYKDYILQDREIQTDKHLIEGKLVHCLLFEPENLENKFKIVPGKTPSDNVKRVLKAMSQETDAEELDDVKDDLIIQHLKYQNLYQSLKTDEQRVAKIRVDDFKPYWKFLTNKNIDVINNDTLEACKKYVEILKSNEEVSSLFKNEVTDFELEANEVHVEKYLQCKLAGSYEFGLHGYIDYYKIDHEKKEVTICDLKTTSKTVAEFAETVDYYNYWLQAAIYMKLVYENLTREVQDNYQILFKFVVIDKYNQVYVFEVMQGTKANWTQGLADILYRANFHYNSKDYSLPYDFLTKKQYL